MAIVKVNVAISLVCFLCGCHCRRWQRRLKNQRTTSSSWPGHSDRERLPERHEGHDTLRELAVLLFAPAAAPQKISTNAATSRQGLLKSRPTVTMAEPMSNYFDSDARNRLKVKQILANGPELCDKSVLVYAWCRTVRAQKEVTFVQVNDGSSLSNLQIVLTDETSKEGFDDGDAKLSTGCAVAVEGTLRESQGKGQDYEIVANRIELKGACPADYPIQKKGISPEYLRGVAHLRARTNAQAAVARVRSGLAYATHKYFQDEGFLYLQSPLITASDCEGAGEMFRVTTLPLEDISKVPREVNGSGADFTKDFFSKPSYLTVSGQLSGETYASALGDIYTFGPTFRAENSQTTRHLAEFHMIEPEMAFCGLDCAMDRAEAYIQYAVKHVLNTCEGDLQFFQKFMDKGLMKRLEDLVGKPFGRVTYKDAIALLQKEIAKDVSKWQYPHVEFGTDLSTEHERWLAEKHFGGAVFVYNYPRKIKSFYMRDGSGDDADTCESFDLLVPGVGELVGGSAREERLDVLRKKLEEFGLDEKDYWWYMDLRRFGSVPHAGFGLGFERLVCYVTGIENIREAIAYPRYPGSAEF